MEENIRLFQANTFVDSNSHMPASDGVLLFILNSMFKEKVVIFPKIKASEVLFFTLRISLRITILRLGCLVQ
jgi:hypothetical protein